MTKLREILMTLMVMISASQGYKKAGNLLVIAILTVCIYPAMAETVQGGNPSAVIDEKYSAAEAGALKSLISETFHQFSKNPDTGAWYATNSGGQVAFTYDGTARFSGPDTNFGMTLTGVGRGNDLSPVGTGVAQADGRQLNITWEGYTEWYRNADTGVEQGITIPTRPAGTGPLKAGFTLDGDGTFEVSDRQNLMFTSSVGTTGMTYTGITAFAADGTKLPASLETDGKMLYWTVDDTGASYPVTIDPVIAASCKIKGGAVDDRYGSSVAISADGSVVLAGAEYASPGASRCGAANLFVRPTGGWSGTKTASGAQATFTGEPVVGELFGCDVAISADGTQALIGASAHDHSGKFNAGGAYLFKMPAGGWNGAWRSAANADVKFPGNAADDSLGHEVDISADGNTVLLGAPYASPGAFLCGAAALYVKPVAGWAAVTPTSSAKAIFTGEPVTEEVFGSSVAISADGTQALIGATMHNHNGKTDAGAAYLFKMPAGGWNGAWRSATNADVMFPGNAVGDRLGNDVDISADGNTVLLGAESASPGASYCGAAALYVKPASGWAAITPTSSAKATFTGAAANDMFGNSVAISADGTQALIGAQHYDTAGKNNAGAAYLFRMPAGGWNGAWKNANAATATFQGEAVNDYFSEAVAISADGTQALIGAYGHDTDGKTDAGTVYLFRLPKSPATSEIGVWRPTTHQWFLDYSGNGAYSAANDRYYTLGANGYKPVTGDWNKDGYSEIGVWRPTTHEWFMDYNGDGAYSAANDRHYTFGANGDIPVTGDWNKDWYSEIGVWRPSTHEWFLDWSGNGAYSEANDRHYIFGSNGDIPGTGDWNKDGYGEIGVWRPSTHEWFMDYNGDGRYSGPEVDDYTTFGANGDKPVTGDWNKDGKTEIGVWRPASHQWLLDWSGNGVFGSGDMKYTLGANGDVPVTGAWSGPSGSASIESVDLTETVKPVVQVPGVSMPGAAIPRVEMPVRSSNIVTPANMGGTPANKNPLVAGGGVKIPDIP